MGAQPWFFFLQTFGCKVNQYETEAIREAWQGLGGQEVEEPSKAQVQCINSCAITAKGVRDCRAALGRLHRANPKALLLVTGCAAPLLAQSEDGGIRADRFIAPSDKALLLKDPRSLPLLAPKPTQGPPTYPPLQISASVRARPVLKVQDGCSHRCTYCIVPFVRKQPVSRAPEQVLREAQRLFHAGYCELIIAGINLQQYGRDVPAYGNLWQLLRFLEKNLAAEFAGRIRLRISSLEPSQLTEEGLETLAQSRILCPHLHLSLQHASKNVLRRMGRGHYTIEEVTQSLARIHSFWPLASLGCDLIAGFPGETDEDHAFLLTAMRDLPLTYAHVFPYSPRPYTAAASFPNQIPDAVKRLRASALRTLFLEKTKAYRARLLKEKAPLAIVATHQKKGEAMCTGIAQYYVTCLWKRLASHEERKDGFLWATPTALCGNALEVCLSNAPLS